MQPRVSITLAWDNIDRLEETLLGERTPQRVYGITVQAKHFGPQLRPLEPLTLIVKTKRGASRHWMQKIFPFKMQKSVPVLVLENLKKLPAKKPKQSLNGDAKQKVGG